MNEEEIREFDKIVEILDNMSEEEFEALNIEEEFKEESKTVLYYIDKFVNG